MLRHPVDLSAHIPVLPPFAAEIAEVCSRFKCTITLEQENIVLNLKSMIGLLSQQLPQNGLLTLVTDGDDEGDAMNALLPLLAG